MLDNEGDLVQGANDVWSLKRSKWMDIAGAKALKKRLGLDGVDEAPPATEFTAVPADAPPVYHWTGVNKPPDQSPARDADEGSASVAGTSLFRRLGLSFR
jgi:hypothetical protein